MGSRHFAGKKTSLLRGTKILNERKKHLQILSLVLYCTQYRTFQGLDGQLPVVLVMADSVMMDAPTNESVQPFSTATECA